MIIDKREEGNNVIVTICENRLDAAAAVDFKARVLEYIDGGAKDMIIDLTEVDFIDSSGLGSLVSILKALSKEGSLVITGLKKKTEQIFKLTRMDSVFTIYPSVNEALEAA